MQTCLLLASLVANAELNTCVPHMHVCMFTTADPSVERGKCQQGHTQGVCKACGTCPVIKSLSKQCYMPLSDNKTSKSWFYPLSISSTKHLCEACAWPGASTSCFMALWYYNCQSSFSYSQIEARGGGLGIQLPGLNTLINIRRGVFLSASLG